MQRPTHQEIMKMYSADQQKRLRRAYMLEKQAVMGAIFNTLVELSTDGPVKSMTLLKSIDLRNSDSEIRSWIRYMVRRGFVEVLTNFSTKSSNFHVYLPTEYGKCYFVPPYRDRVEEVYIPDFIEEKQKKLQNERGNTYNAKFNNMSERTQLQLLNMAKKLLATDREIIASSQLLDLTRLKKANLQELNGLLFYLTVNGYMKRIGTNLYIKCSQLETFVTDHPLSKFIQARATHNASNPRLIKERILTECSKYMASHFNRFIAQLVVAKSRKRYQKFLSIFLKDGKSVFHSTENLLKYFNNLTTAVNTLRQHVKLGCILGLLQRNNPLPGDSKCNFQYTITDDGISFITATFFDEEKYLERIRLFSEKNPAKTVLLKYPIQQKQKFLAETLLLIQHGHNIRAAKDYHEKSVLFEKVSAMQISNFINNCISGGFLVSDVRGYLKVTQKGLDMIHTDIFFISEEYHNKSLMSHSKEDQFKWRSLYSIHYAPRLKKILEVCLRPEYKDRWVYSTILNFHIPEYNAGLLYNAARYLVALGYLKDTELRVSGEYRAAGFKITESGTDFYQSIKDHPACQS